MMNPIWRGRTLSVVLLLALLLPSVGHPTLAALPKAAEQSPSPIQSHRYEQLPSATAVLQADSPEWTWMNPLPQGNSLSAVWGSGQDDVFAVGQRGTILHFNGRAWSAMQSGTTALLRDIWGTGPNDVWVVGTDSDLETGRQGVVLHYDGVQWNLVAHGLADSLGVWGSGRGDLFVPSRDRVLHYDGSGWTEMSTSTEYYSFPGVWGNREDDVFVVGGEGVRSIYGAILHFDGSRWTRMDDDLCGPLADVYGNGPDDIFAVGMSGAIRHYNGNRWAKMESGVKAHLYDVWGSDAADVFAVGIDGSILNYDGESWVEMDSGTTNSLNGIWGTNSSNVFAVGQYGIILHYNGDRWSPMSESATYANLYAVWGHSQSDVFAVGSEGAIVHYDGTRWRAMAHENTHSLLDLWGSRSDNVFAVGNEGTILRYDGNTWSRMNTGTTHYIEGVWGSSSTDVFAVGGTYDLDAKKSLCTILHYDGQRWSKMASSCTDWLKAVWGSGPADVFALASSAILHYDGNTWTEMNIGTAGFLKDIWGSGPDDVYAVGGYGDTILHYDGNTWTEINIGTTDSLGDIWGSGPDDVYAVGSSIHHYDGRSWRPINVSGDSLWGTGQGDLFCVGWGGQILYYGGEPSPRLTYVGHTQINGRSAHVLDEDDERITPGDHVHLRLPFTNVGNAVLANAVITITGEHPTFGSVGVKIHNGISWDSFKQPVALTPPTLEPGQTGIADFWICVTNPDPDILQATPTGTWLRLSNGDEDWTVSISLDTVAFDIAEHRDMLASSCLHSPDDPQIQRYAQYAAGTLEEATPPSNTGDPDTAQQAVINVVRRINRIDGEFRYGGLRVWRVPDTELLADRWDFMGECRHFADLTIGLLRSIGLPTRYIRGNVTVEDPWPGAAHMWDEVYLGDDQWEFVDATNRLWYSRFPVAWAWADRYALSTASVLTLHTCNHFCIADFGCAACRIGSGETYPGSLYWPGPGCMDDVSSSYESNLGNEAHGTQLQTGSQYIPLKVSAPVFVTRDEEFEVVATATNSTTVAWDSLALAVSPYLEAGWDEPIYAVNPTSHTVASISPGEAVTVSWTVTPLLTGTPLPLQVVASSGEMLGVYEQLQNVNEPDTLPNLLLSAGCDDRIVKVGALVTLTTFVADEQLRVMNDGLSTITATVYATPTLDFSTVSTLTYHADSQHYVCELTLPDDAPIGRYQVEYSAARPGYDIARETSSFFVVPTLTMKLIADPPVLNLTDPITLTARVYDRGTAIGQAGVYAEIATPDGVASIPLYSAGAGVYTATLRPADIVGVADIPLSPGLWTITAIGNHQGGIGAASQAITLRHGIYLPVTLSSW